jgi:hypothetical protein
VSPTCATCRYWERRHTYGDCTLIGDWPRYEPEPADWPASDNAWVAPFAGAEGASLVTAPTFGCNEHVGRPAPQENTP